MSKVEWRERKRERERRRDKRKNREQWNRAKRERKRVSGREERRGLITIMVKLDKMEQRTLFHNENPKLNPY